MSDNFNDVGEFHSKFGLRRVLEVFPPGPPQLSEEELEQLLDFRRIFLEEELAEFTTAMSGMDFVEMADALVDLVYVAMGTAHLLGLPWHELWDEVQATNMAKKRAAANGADSKRGSSWDVVKPEGWQPPDIRGILYKHGFDVGCQVHGIRHCTICLYDRGGEIWTDSASQGPSDVH
jgi:predicted HAD superfamily Cof-like phosphohydrolase